MIQIVEPVDEDGATCPPDFWERVDADPGVVVVVWRADEAIGVFTTLDKARRWAIGQAVPCVIAPQRLDDPAWGNEMLQ